MESVSTKCQFERRVSSGGFIDVLIPDSRTLAEQKSIGSNLDTPEIRQGKEGYSLSAGAKLRRKYAIVTVIALYCRPQF